MRWQDLRMGWRLSRTPEKFEVNQEESVENGTTKVFRKINSPTPTRHFHLIVISGSDRGRDFLLVPASLSIGRKEDAFIRLTDYKVSREHASLQYRSRDERFVLEDLGSTNGTFLNERRIRREMLRSGDLIKVGETTLQFVMVETPGKG
ncbi:MAG TPA: FHA domain-containing protein [Bacillota bacterium]|nr:FHA domain-containing protein [Bacillota bacterium]